MFVATLDQQPKTISNILTLLVAMLNCARDLGWLLTVPRIRKPRVRLCQLRRTDEERHGAACADRRCAALHASRMAPRESIGRSSSGPQGHRSRPLSCRVPGSLASCARARWVPEREGGQAGVEVHHLHGVRHTFASHWMVGGGDLFRLQRVLGHESSSMTDRTRIFPPTSLPGTMAGLGRVPCGAPASFACGARATQLHR